MTKRFCALTVLHEYKKELNTPLTIITTVANTLYLQYECSGAGYVKGRQT